jgi:hypothetical protein
MARYTSILLPLAKSRKRRLQEAAESRGETLESFILEAAEAEAARIGKWLSSRGHSVDQRIYSSGPGPGQVFSQTGDGEYQVEAQQVALELGWNQGSSDEWLDDVDRLIEGLDGLDGKQSSSVHHAPTSQDARRSFRRAIDSVQVLNPVRGVVVDMSETGLGIETEGPFSVPEEIHLTIGQAMSCAKVRAEVRWCALTRTESFSNGDIIPIYRSGLAFVGN